MKRQLPLPLGLTEQANLARFWDHFGMSPELSTKALHFLDKKKASRKPKKKVKPRTKHAD
jgi:hypothetical protein